MSEWISVSDRLPENYDDVLVAFNDGEKTKVCKCILYRHWGDWYTLDTTRYEGMVTHWMPLPEPPA